jgi:antitoxin ParD1/3/4
MKKVLSETDRVRHSLCLQGIKELRKVWQQATEDSSPCVAADEVLDRLERKYQAPTNGSRA